MDLMLLLFQRSGLIGSGREQSEEKEEKKLDRREDEPVDVLDVFGLKWRLADQEGVAVVD